VLRKALSHAQAPVRRGAALALAEIGTEAKGAVAALEKGLRQDEAEVVSRACASALGRIGSAGVPSLVRGLKDDRAGVREASARALGALGPEARAALDTLEGMKEEKDPEVKEAVAEALERINARGLAAWLSCKAASGEEGGRRAACPR
jgi:HEAT repeat protein